MKLQKLLIPLTALLITLSTHTMWEDSKVTLWNNTPFQLGLAVDAGGVPGVTLQATSINPTERKQVLQFTRDKGVTSGKEFIINMNIIIPEFKQLEQNNQVVAFSARFKLAGKLIGSDYWYSLNGGGNPQVPYFEEPWFNDYSNHLKIVDRGRERFIISYHGVRTGSTDNIEYVINWVPKYPEPAPTGPNELSVGFQNVWMRPSTVAIGCVKQRAPAIAQLIGKNYDIVIFSELFDSNSEILLNAMKNLGYVHQTKIVGKGSSLSAGFLNGGVAIVSKHPFATLDNGQPYKEILFPGTACAKDDCAAAKGVIYAKVMKQNKPYHVFATHANASYSMPPDDKTVTARAKQFNDLKTFMNAQNIPKTEPVIIAGDMNVDMTHPMANVNNFDYLGLFQYRETGGQKNINEYQNMLNVLHAAHPTLRGYQGISEVQRDNNRYTMNPVLNRLSTDAALNANDVQFLDYVLYSKDHLQPIDSFNEMRMIGVDAPYSCTSTGISDLGKTIDYATAVSDHWFIYGYFKFPN